MRNSRIKLKMGVCPECPDGSEPKPLIAKKCEIHYWQGKKVGHVIAKKSENQKERDKRYKPIRDRFILAHPKCMIIRDDCTIRATEVHHPEGKIGELYFDDSIFVAACHRCHRWAEEHPTEAKLLGFSRDRLNVK